MEQELVSFEAMPPQSGEHRLTQLKIANRKFGIEERKKFIVKLRAILEERRDKVPNELIQTLDNPHA